MSTQQGHLFIIGGREDRRDVKTVLRRYVELCGGPGCSIAVLPSASTIPNKIWKIYDQALGELGVKHRFPVFIESRDEASNPICVAKILEADGIFLSGGDQKRLLKILGDTPVHVAIYAALNEHGACIGGTSAGASAMSRHMLARGTREVLPDKQTAKIEPGFGFLPRVIIDQHFSERQRLARLLSAVAQKPDLIGVGIDEDTALIIQPGRSLEVVGTGAVTLLDGRRMASNIRHAGIAEPLELINMALHLLPAGKKYRLEKLDDPSAGSVAQGALREILTLVTGM